MPKKMQKSYEVNILSLSSVKELQKNLRSYRDYITRRCRVLVQRLAEKGIVVAQARLDETDEGKTITLRIETENIHRGGSAKIIGVGPIKSVEGREPFSIMLAVEFGAGTSLNSTLNPKASELGYGPTTYPGQTHANEPYWHYWDTETESWKSTKGIKATMPMYSAFLEVYKVAQQTAIEVFR